MLTTDEDLTDIAELNPFRYRGYYYDTESGLYYLNSRYYDPETGRFINADAFVSTGQGLSGNNMFAYCGNNPVNFIDESGLLFFAALGAAIGAASAFVDALWDGQSITDAKKSACAGAASGFISGLGVDIAVVVTAVGSPVAGLYVAGTMGAIGGVVGTGMANDWKVDPFDYVASAIVGGTMNLLSLGTAGEIAKGTFKTMVGSLLRNGIADLGENATMGTVVAFGTLLITRALTDNFERTTELIEKIKSGEVR